MEHAVRHGLPIERARALARRAVASYAQRFAKFAPEVHWRSEGEAEVRFTAKGLSLKGGFRVEPDRFRMQLEVPFLLRPLSRRALEVIEAEVQRWIADEARSFAQAEADGQGSGSA